MIKAPLTLDLAEKAFNFVALFWVGGGLQPFKQTLLSRKEFGKGCYRASYAGRNVNSGLGGDTGR